MDNSLTAQIQEAFGNKSLYEVLEVECSASAEDIRRAYRRLALKLHPDKGGDAEQFKALSVVHAILSDEAKRRLYDENGEIDTHEMSDEAEVWYDYFRNLFPKVTIQKIEEFSREYIASEEERGDVIKYFNKYKGDFNPLMDSIMLAEEEDAERIADIVKDCFATGELRKYRERFDSSSLRYIEQYNKRALAATANSSKRRGAGEADTAAEKSKKVKKQEDENHLLQQMLANNARRRSGESAFAEILSKYSNESGGGRKKNSSKKSSARAHEDISDDAFEATQARLLSTAKRNKDK